LGWRSEGHNPATWKGYLDQEFAGQKSQDIKHHPALHYDDAPRFAAELRQRDGVAAKALEVLLLTAVRTGDVRFAKWENIDLERRTWTIPKTKNYSALDVHLTHRVIEILRGLLRHDGNPYVFAGSRRVGRPIHEKEMRKVMSALRPGFAPHGLRATFKSWASKRLFRFEVVEMTLAHKVGSHVERVYERENFGAEREQLLDAWSEYLLRPVESVGGRADSAKASHNLKHQATT
jgi:integrase